MKKTELCEPKHLCQKLQYLIGVPAQYLDNFEALDQSPYTDIRNLCSMRSIIIEKFNNISTKLRKLKSLSNIEDTCHFVVACENNGIHHTTHYPLHLYVIELNKIINEKIESISLEFSPIPAKWIQELFMMPNGDTMNGVKEAIRRYRKFKNSYPYQKYINWNFALTSEEQRSKIFLGSDAALQEILEEAHSNKLLEFIETSQKVVVVVDCMTSDAQGLYDSLLPIHTSISKLILIEDEYTNALSLWKELEYDFKNAEVAVECNKISRLKSAKPLIGYRMVAKICEEFYKNDAKKIILATSDSQMWALINLLPAEDIFVIAEKSKSGDGFIEALTRNKIRYLFTENIPSESRELKDRVMHRAIMEKLNTIRTSEVNLYRLVIDVARMMKIYLEKDAIDAYIQWATEKLELYKVDENVNNTENELWLVHDTECDIFQEDILKRNISETHNINIPFDSTSVLGDFIGIARDIVAIVECNNCDAQRTYDSLRNYAQYLKKIVLIDDMHTNVRWDVFSQYFIDNGVVVEHDQMNRLSQYKSLNNLRMAAKACAEHYQNNQKRFIFANSNSDVWAMISSLPDAEILVLAEEYKCGEILINALERNNVPWVITKYNPETSSPLILNIAQEPISTRLNLLIRKNETPIHAWPVIVEVDQSLNLYLNDEEFKACMEWAIQELLKLTESRRTDNPAEFC